VVEHYLHTVGVAGSKPAARTIFTEENEGVQQICTEFAQNFKPSPKGSVNFPLTIKYRSVSARIYGRTKEFPYYRFRYKAAGKLKTITFRSLAEARKKGKKILKDIHEGSQAAALSPSQSRDAIAAFEQLDSYYKKTGKRISLLSAVSRFTEASTKLGDRPMNDAVDGYLSTVANITRKDLMEAVNEFLRINAPLTQSENGKRAQLSEKYAYNREHYLTKFAETFPNLAVCDLAKEQLDLFISSLTKSTAKKPDKVKKVSAKTRNHYRTALRQFLSWAVRKDYLPSNHRLGEADQMRRELANTSEILHYTPEEFHAMLAASDDIMRPMVAIGGLAGLRTSELLRLDWSDVWRTEGHIVVTAQKSKTRQRRLVEISTDLAEWLKPYRKRDTGNVWELNENKFQKAFSALCTQAKVKGKAVTRKTNGLRHAFCTYHFALHANENLTAAQAGHSPAMIHAHYKGLATKAEAESWFNVRPPKTPS
jgi:integrase